MHLFICLFLIHILHGFSYKKFLKLSAESDLVPVYRMKPFFKNVVGMDQNFMPHQSYLSPKLHKYQHNENIDYEDRLFRLKRNDFNLNSANYMSLQDKRFDPNSKNDPRDEDPGLVEIYSDVPTDGTDRSPASEIKKPIEEQPAKDVDESTTKRPSHKKGHSHQRKKSHSRLSKNKDNQRASSKLKTKEKGNTDSRARYAKERGTTMSDWKFTDRMKALWNFLLMHKSSLEELARKHKRSTQVVQTGPPCINCRGIVFSKDLTQIHLVFSPTDLIIILFTCSIASGMIFLIVGFILVSNREAVMSFMANKFSYKC
ncbi:hypothetical protein SNEBB_005846 [Seison nebaliae]|nr:hypothetical protein SNEBB_005846 [Seison nebaliae]